MKLKKKLINEMKKKQKQSRKKILREKLLLHLKKLLTHEFLDFYHDRPSFLATSGRREISETGRTHAPQP